MHRISPKFAGQFVAHFKAGLACAAITTLLLAGAAGHATDLITNGGFESNTGNGQVGVNTSVTDWTVTDIGNGTYTFLYAAGTADTTGANGQYVNVALWGPNDGSANGLPASSPAGGYYMAEDSDFQVGPIQQTINGLIVGDTYTLGFYWAAAQQYLFTGVNSSGFEVSLGGQTFSTALDTIPSEGFSGWQYQTFNYTPTSSSELLSFLAYGSPQVPPFALLDGVSLNGTSAVPEPETWALLLTGLMAGAGLLKSRKWLRRPQQSI